MFERFAEADGNFRTKDAEHRMLIEFISVCRAHMRYKAVGQSLLQLNHTVRFELISDFELQSQLIAISQ